MRRKKRGHIWAWVLVLALLVAAGLVVFSMVRQKAHEQRKLAEAKGEEKAGAREAREREARQGEAGNKLEATRTAPGQKRLALPFGPGSPAVREKILAEGTEGLRPPGQEDYCTQIENAVLDFFHHLDRASYVQRLGSDVDAYGRFRKVLRMLSSQPPIPAGEGADSRIINSNIFHFFRRLDRADLRLIREVMRNEGDTLEMDLDLFYRWLMLENRCPDPEGIKPSLDVLYQYAGFFMNTIGGRAYLFRRPLGVRLLMSYYCLLIVHEADIRGKNSYGIDIFPEIAPLAREISIYPDFHFQKEYVQQLGKIESYYLAKR